ncbi:unnamed protein product [Strongylus vulgaris]|uniref:Uncharacterized protein n=1 Tax=Strongylus vulgaris TaxID=40348 RepID=A0A3P7I501_STRVU|nr:unnamed protein product [Strongylus vulgaris]
MVPGGHQYPQVVILPAEPELGNTNPDDPPAYSVVVNSGGGTVETAKEETQPPKYSELETPSDSNTSEYVRLENRFCTSRKLLV